MKCVLCTSFTSKTNADWIRHLDVVHHLTQKQYSIAAGAVQKAYGGLEAFQRAAKMAGLVLMLAMSVGCRGVDRLLGNDDKDPAVPPAGPAQIAGTYSGSGTLSGDITINGHACTMIMDVPVQNGGSVSGTWVINIPNSNQPGGPPDFPAAQGTVSGTVDASGLFTYTLVESPACPADSHGTGQIIGNSMAVSFTGSGNPSCGLWFDGGSGTLTK